MCIFLVPHQCFRRVLFHLSIACITCFNTPLLARIFACYCCPIHACYLALFVTEKCYFGGCLATVLHVMYQLCMFSMAIGHSGCLLSHFGTIPGVWYHFPTFRDCFASFVSAEIPFACLHIIFHVISCFNALPRFARPCARISRHPIFISGLLYDCGWGPLVLV